MQVLIASIGSVIVKLYTGFYGSIFYRVERILHLYFFLFTVNFMGKCSQFLTIVYVKNIFLKSTFCREPTYTFIVEFQKLFDNVQNIFDYCD